MAWLERENQLLANHIEAIEDAVQWCINNQVQLTFITSTTEEVVAIRWGIAYHAAGKDFLSAVDHARARESEVVHL